MADNIIKFLTIREAVYTVKRMFRNVHADSRLPNKLVYSLLTKHSKWLINRDSDKLKLIRKHDIYQKVKCLKVIEAPSVDPCCGLRLPSCTIYRTEVKLPEMFEDSAGVLIHNITSVDGWTDIILTTASSIKRKKNNPWKGKGKKSIYCFYNDGYLYFPEAHLKIIEVEAMFIKEVEPKENCEPCKDCENNCKRFMDGKFMIPGYLEAQMYDFVIKDLANTFQRIPETSHELNKNDSNPK